MSRRLAGLIGLATLFLAGAHPGSDVAQGANDVGRGRDFVRRVGRALYLRGSSFRVAGASNYYLM
jgi:hypothetical protein